MCRAAAGSAPRLVIWTCGRTSGTCTVTLGGRCRAGFDKDLAQKVRARRGRCGRIRERHSEWCTEHVTLVVGSVFWWPKSATRGETREPVSERSHDENCANVRAEGAGIIFRCIWSDGCHQFASASHLDLWLHAEGPHCGPPSCVRVALVVVFLRMVSSFAGPACELCLVLLVLEHSSL